MEHQVASTRDQVVTVVPHPLDNSLMVQHQDSNLTGPHQVSMVLLDIVVPHPLDSLELLATVAPHHLVSLALEDLNQEVMVHRHPKVGGVLHLV